MGLDASVMCNCYRLGKTQPCPFPEHFYIDEDGFPALQLPPKNNVDQLDIFDKWLATCCEHAHMDYAAVFVANWKGYQSFLQALEQLGWERFPMLHAELPDGNQGLTSPEAASDALHELELFRQESGGIIKTFLIDSDTNELLAISAMAYGGMFGSDGRTGMNLGFDEAGFYIVDSWELNREMFRAMRFEQQVLEPQSLGRPQQFEFIDLDTGRRFVSSTPLKLFVRNGAGQLKQVYPRRVHIESRGVDAQHFAYILEPLTYIFQAAVETGNPVRWS